MIANTTWSDGLVHPASGLLLENACENIPPDHSIDVCSVHLWLARALTLSSCTRATPNPGPRATRSSGVPWLASISQCALCSGGPTERSDHIHGRRRQILEERGCACYHARIRLFPQLKPTQHEWTDILTMPNLPPSPLDQGTQ